MTAKRKKKRERELTASNPTEFLRLKEGEEIMVRMGEIVDTRFGPTREVFDEDGVIYRLPTHTTLRPVQSVPEGSSVRLVYNGMEKSQTGRDYHSWDAFLQEGK